MHTCLYMCLYNYVTLIVTGFTKTVLIGTFCISRNCYHFEMFKQTWLTCASYIVAKPDLCFIYETVAISLLYLYSKSGLATANSSAQYLLLVFEIVFYNPCNIMGVVIRWWVGVREAEGWLGVGGQAEGRPSLPLEHKQRCHALSRWQGCTQSTG